MIKTIRTIINFILLLLTLGVIGGMEQGTISLGHGVYSSIIICFIALLINIRRF